MSMKKIAFAASAAALMAGTSAYASVIDRPFFKVLGVVIVWGADDFDSTGGVAPVVSDFVLLTNASGAAGADLIAGDVHAVVTGSLDPVDGAAATSGTVDPITGATTVGTNTYSYTDDGDGVLNAADSMTAFGLDGNTDVDGSLSNAHTSTFYVASNAAFDIYATSSTATATGDFLADGLDESNISFALAVDATAATVAGLSVGADAQDPSTGGTGVIAAVNSLDDMATATKVFDGGQRTAATRGSIADQSVAFNMTYELLDPTGTVGDTGYDLSMGSGTIYADVTYTVYVP
ncbi:MAG: hypothetical protein V3U82_01120 [Robiginitomaculum sp.]